MVGTEYDEQHAILADPVYTNAKAVLSRLEQLTGFALVHYTPDVAFYLKKLKKHTGKYAYSVSSIIAVLYFKKVISRGEAFALLEEFGGSKKRFKDVYFLLTKLDRETRKERRKVICPVCGQVGYLVIEKGKYIRVKHYENGTIKSCYVGKIKTS